MSSTPHSRRAHTRPLGLCIVLCISAYASLLASPCRAQDAPKNNQQVSEAARREKARKAAQQKKESHVYTNEDLKQSQILTQQDRSRIEARKNNPATTPANPAQPSVNAKKNSAPESLGEVARRYRRQKLENSQAAKRHPPSRFPMDLSQPSFAAPVQPVAPRISPNSHPRQSAKPLPRISPSRRDPFSRQICPLHRNPPSRSSTQRLTPLQSAPLRLPRRLNCCSPPNQFLQLRRLCLAPRLSLLP